MASRVGHTTPVSPLGGGALQSQYEALKNGLHLGQVHVTNDKARVTCSVALSVLAYFLLVRLYGREEASRSVEILTLRALRRTVLCSGGSANGNRLGILSSHVALAMSPCLCPCRSLPWRLAAFFLTCPRVIAISRARCSASPKTDLFIHVFAGTTKKSPRVF
jgi:hypothetical protein